MTAADVKRVANKYLTNGRVVLSIVPVGKPIRPRSRTESKKVTRLRRQARRDGGK